MENCTPLKHINVNVSFVDHASSLPYVHHQVGFSTQETIADQMYFENWSCNQGVLIVKYATTNGIFGAANFVNEILSKAQEVNYYREGTHHQNKAAKCSI